MTYATVKDYEVTVRIRNNWMLKAMRDAGFESGMELSRASGVGGRQIYLYLSLKLPFMKMDGTWKTDAIAIADALGCAPDALVPPQHLRDALKKNKGTFEADFDEVAALVDYRNEGNPFLLIQQKETSLALIKAMQLRLTPRQQRILVLTYGLGREPPQTVEQLSKLMKVSESRLRQIQKTAISKLRVGSLSNFRFVSQHLSIEQRNAGEALREAMEP